ncbi:MAG: hypothetical protein H6581_03850 [Bacteroidia bacterium]|nr:hypothetical protein [Bacteroidia bacterium]
MKRQLIALLSILAFSTSCQKEHFPSNPGFIRFFGGYGNELGYDVIEAHESGYLIGGRTEVEGKGNQAIIIKTDSNGVEEWSMEWGEEFSDAIYGVDRAEFPNYIAYGHTSGPSGQPLAMCLKIGPDGDLLSEKIFTHSASSRFWTGTRISQGGYALGGYTSNWPFLAILDENLDTIKTTIFDSLNGTIRGIAENTQGQLVVMGFGKGLKNGAGNYDTFIQKLDYSYNPAADIQVFGGPLEDISLGLLALKEGGYAVSGYSQNDDLPGESRSVWVFRVDENLNLKWNEYYGWKRSDRAQVTGWVQLRDGNLLVPGDSKNFSNGLWDFYLLKINVETGQTIWQRSYGGRGEDDARSCLETENGMLVFVGDSKSLEGMDGDIVLMKTDSRGIIGED